MGYEYNFPPISCDDGFLYERQVVKVGFEFMELLENQFGGPVHDCIEEALDTIHALETYLRRLEPIARAEGYTVDSVAAEVIEKNRKRGYYDA